MNITTTTTSTTNTNTIIIEPIQYNDFCIIEDIGYQCLPIYYKLYDLLELSKTSKYIMLKATINNTIVGFIIAEKKNKVIKEYLHIMSIAVLEKYRKHYIGTKLLHAIQQQYDKITLYVQTNNYVAIQFYQKNGFLRSYMLTRYYPTLDCKDAYLYIYSK